ncbi:MAG: NAD(P)H-dependent oxidoreductase [Weeksellaceae bacterium]|nr:NAD(P)H-dependent oxidoreductase [Weeksellaceae bacterium]
MNILVILGHPRKDSFCGALANKYMEGCLQAGHTINFLPLSDLNFDVDVQTVHPQDQEVEPDLEHAKILISEADHIAVFYPTWWGSMPAVLKGFWDRVFVPGFAFREINLGNYEKYLTGKSAELFINLDTPVFVYKYFMGAPGTKSVKNNTLKFCGIEPVRTTHFSPINHSTAEQRNKWLQKCFEKGIKAEKVHNDPLHQFMQKIAPWVQAIRFQFYPMTFIAYWAGALLSRQISGDWNWLAFIIGYVILFLIENYTVFTNELYDQKTDEANENFGPFSGGSRVLVSNKLSGKQLKRGAGITAALITLLSILLYFSSPASALILTAYVGITWFLGHAYTVPPFKFSYRTLGEITVGITHSFCVLLGGFLIQLGHLYNKEVWWLAVPLFISILPSITLSGIPDRRADQMANKKTIAVRLGVTNSIKFVMFITAIAVIVPIILYHTILQQQLSWAVYLVIPHGIFLIYKLREYLQLKEKPERIDELMVYSLLLMVWYGIIPVIRLLQG